MNVTNISQQLIQLKKQITETEADLISLKTEKKLRHQELEKMKCSNLEEAQKLVNQWTKEYQDLENEIEDLVTDLENEYGEYL